MKDAMPFCIQVRLPPRAEDKARTRPRKMSLGHLLLRAGVGPKQHLCGTGAARSGDSEGPNLAVFLL